MKRLAAVLLTVLTALCLAVFVACDNGNSGTDNDNTDESDGAETEYNITIDNGDGTLTYKGYGGEPSAEFEIPAAVGGKIVTVVAPYAFKDANSITKITVPITVTKIENYAFADCANLVEVEMSNGVVSVGDYVFKGCDALERVILGERVEAISVNAFVGCKNLKSISVKPRNAAYESVNGVLFNKSLKELTVYPIGKEDTSYTVPEQIENICSNAFAGNTHLTKVNLNGVEVIGEQAFYGCTNLIAFTGGDRIENVLGGAFADTAWFNGLNEEYGYLGHILVKYAGNDSVLDLRNAPKPFTIIYDSVFANNEKLTSVILPETVKRIGVGAFAGCGNLENVYLLPVEQRVEIGYSAFDTDNEKTKIRISEQLMRIYAEDLLLKVKGYDKMLDVIPVTVSFDTGTEKSVEPITLNYGCLIDGLPETDYPHRIFDGWFVGSQKYQNGVIWDRFESTTLTAEWEAKAYAVEYVIELKGADNDKRNRPYYDFGENFELYAPSAVRGYDFIGWYGNPEFEGEIITNFNQLTGGDATLYARFEPIEVTVSFDLNYEGAVAVPDTVIKFGSLDYGLPTHEREGYLLKSWYYLKNDIKHEIWNAEKGIYGSWFLLEDVTLYAEWVPLSGETVPSES